MVRIMAKTTDVNPSIMHVTIIENLISQVSGHLEAINAQNADQHEKINDARMLIMEFQKKQLYELRGVFE